MGLESSEVSKNIRIEMVKKDMSVSDLAKAVQLSRSYTSALIHGRIISPNALMKIQNVLGIEGNGSK